MRIIIHLLLLISHCRALEWNCLRTPNEDFLAVREQCTITVEYLSARHERHTCTIHTLSVTSLPVYSTNYTAKRLRINACQLLTISQIPFALPSTLDELDLSSNLLSTVIVSASWPSNLTSLRLDHNANLVDINLSQRRLAALSLRHNHYMQFVALPSQLTHLDLTDCNLFQSPVLVSLKSLAKLTHLSLANNALVRLPRLHEHVQLESLNLSHNRLISIEGPWLDAPLHTVDLRFNDISSLDFLKSSKPKLEARVSELGLRNAQRATGKPIALIIRAMSLR